MSLPAVEAPTYAPHAVREDSFPDCEQFPTPLRVGEPYRVRVFRHPSDNPPGNLGRSGLVGTLGALTPQRQ